MTVKRGGKRRDGGRKGERERRKEGEKEREERGRKGAKGRKGVEFLLFFYRVRRGAEQERLEHQKVSVL